ncbi:CheY-like protein, partial [Basidiobolus meristosporus CBS 931.73]
LAEDNLICQKLAARLLTKNGYDVTTANNGLEAVEAVERSPDYDIALLDIHMPLMGGLEAGRAMRERLGFSGQIVALTANTTSEYQQACVDAGFDAFAPKPIKEQELLTLLTQRSYESKEVSKPKSG